MSAEEIKYTQTQLDRIAVVEKARARAMIEKEACAAAGLFVYARMWDTVVKAIEQDHAMQMRVLKGQLPAAWSTPAPAETVAEPIPFVPRERTLEFDQ